jgi:hypothetical protein
MNFRKRSNRVTFGLEAPAQRRSGRQGEGHLPGMPWPSVRARACGRRPFGTPSTPGNSHQHQGLRQSIASCGGPYRSAGLKTRVRVPLAHIVEPGKVIAGFWRRTFPAAFRGPGRRIKHASVPPLRWTDISTRRNNSSRTCSPISNPPISFRPARRISRSRRLITGRATRSCILVFREESLDEFKFRFRLFQIFDRIWCCGSWRPHVNRARFEGLIENPLSS